MPTATGKKGKSATPSTSPAVARRTRSAKTKVPKTGTKDEVKSKGKAETESKPTVAPATAAKVAQPAKKPTKKATKKADAKAETPVVEEVASVEKKSVNDNNDTNKPAAAKAKGKNQKQTESKTEEPKTSGGDNNNNNNNNSKSKNKNNKRKKTKTDTSTADAPTTDAKVNTPAKPSPELPEVDSAVTALKKNRQNNKKNAAAANTENTNTAKRGKKMQNHAENEHIPSAAEASKEVGEDSDEDAAAMAADSAAAFEQLKSEGAMGAKVAKKIKKQVQNKKKNKNAKVNPKNDNRAVLYLGHIPYGFFEPQMRSYFSQFGKVLRIRISKNRKTGKSRGYAFIEFQEKEVADIVAESMNNYLMYGRILKCEVVDLKALHPLVFKGCNQKLVKPNNIRASKILHNAPKSEEKLKDVQAKLLAKENKKRKKLSELGVDYEFPGYANIEVSKPVVEEKPSSKRKAIGAESTPAKKTTATPSKKKSAKKAVKKA